MATKAELQASLDAKGVDYTQGMTNTKLQSLLDEHDANASASSGKQAPAAGGGTIDLTPLAQQISSLKSTIQGGLNVHVTNGADLR